MHHPTLCAVAAALLAALPGAQAGMYTKSSPVLQVDGKSYQSLIAKSNHTTILEFFAPWCGHCQNLKPAYEKAAKNLEGLANVAAIDCDDDANKPFCGSMGVQGFPTLKIIRPGKKAGKPVVEDYNGPRTATGIVEAVVEKITNHVERVTDKNLDDFLKKSTGPKALLFTEKGTVSALLKAVAIDFLGVINVAQIRSKESKAVAAYGIDKFPTLVLIPEPDATPVKYDGPIKKADMVKFLSQAGAPNPDAAPANDKKRADKKSDKKEKAKSKASPKSKEKKSAAEPEEKASTSTASESSSTPEAQASSAKEVKPVPTIASSVALFDECLKDTLKIPCLVTFVAVDEKGEPGKDVQAALDAFMAVSSSIAENFKGHEPFRLFVVPKTDAVGAAAAKALELTKDIEVVVINARRHWWKHYTGEDFTQKNLLDWVEQVRLGEGAKLKIPEDLIPAAAEATTSSTSSSTAAAESSEETRATDPTPEPETDTETATESTGSGAAHDEL